MFALYLLLAASPEPVVLHWMAPPGCPDEAEIRRRLERSLKDVPPLDRPLVADARVQRVKKMFVLDLRLHNDTHDQTKQLTRRTCDLLSDMAVIHIETTFPSFRSEPALPPVAAPKPAALPALPARPKRRLGGSLRFGGVGGGMHTGFSDKLVAFGGPSLHLGLRGPGWRIEAGGHYLISPTRPYTVTDATFRTSWNVVGGQVSACGAAVARPAAELHLCGGFEIGALRGKLERSEILIEGERATAIWLGLHAGPLLTVRLHRAVHLWASATPVLAYTGQVAITVRTMNYHADRMWWQLRGAMGIEVRWGS